MQTRGNLHPLQQEPLSKNVARGGTTHGSMLLTKGIQTALPLKPRNRHRRAKWPSKNVARGGTTHGLMPPTDGAQTALPFKQVPQGP